VLSIRHSSFVIRNLKYFLMKILVINCGSSSLKFQLIDIRQIEIHETLLAKGLAERIGTNNSAVSCTNASGGSLHVEKSIPDHRAAVEAVFDFLLESGILTNRAEIEGVGHRVVHGGEHFRESVRINADVERAIEAYSAMAPLHNPHNLGGYRAVRELLPGVPQVAVFDTAFHSTIPPRAYLYAIPYQYYEKDRVRRFGFHGTSHRFVTNRFAQIEHTSTRSWKLITCHLGNGCSVCAVDRGRSVDTSMGFTPVEGLMMGTRSGDVDPGALLYLMELHHWTPEQVDEVLNEQSGLLGVSGTSSDMRDLLQSRHAGDDRARLAIRMFCYSARKYIASYFAALRGAHALIFTGGIGENAFQIRAEICSGLSSLGLILDMELNKSALGIEREISAAESQIKVWVIPTNEELLIARDTVRCILGLPLT
jgi:acetate kinase